MAHSIQAREVRLTSGLRIYDEKGPLQFSAKNLTYYHDISGTKVHSDCYKTFDFINHLKELFPKLTDETEILERLFYKLVIQGVDEPTQQSFSKSDESFNIMGLELRKPTFLQPNTELGQVEELRVKYTDKASSQLQPCVTSDLVKQAAKQAKLVLNTPHATPSWEELTQETKGFLSVTLATANCFEKVFTTIIEQIVSKDNTTGPISPWCVVDPAEQTKPYYKELKQGFFQAAIKFLPEGKDSQVPICEPKDNMSSALHELLGGKDGGQNRTIIVVSSRTSFAGNATLKEAQKLIELSKKTDTSIYMVLPISNKT